MTGTAARSGGNRSVSSCDATPDNGPPTEPKGLPPDVSAKWRQIVADIPKGVLRRVDGHLLVNLARLLTVADSLFDVLAIDAGNDRVRRQYLQTFDRIQRLSALFALSPADRRRLKLDESEKDEDSFAIWLAERKGESRTVA